MLYIHLALIAQGILNLLLAITVRHVSKTYKIPLTIHNAPIVGLWSIGLALLMWLSVTVPTCFLGFGVFVGWITWFGQSQVNDGTSLFGRVLNSIVSMLMWAQLVTLIIFFALHEKQIDIQHEKPQP